jgi:uncharacterized membrane protein YkvA (DUF1232 family)
MTADDPELSVPDWALEAARRPDARARVDARLRPLLAKLHDARLVERAKELYGYLTDPRVPTRYKAIILAGLLYLVNPFDAVPDVLPGVGYLDDAAVLLAVLEAVRRVVLVAEDSAKRVVSHAVAETEEAFARRGVQQISLSLWAVTLAACVGLVYLVARETLVPGAHGVDPFLVAALVIGVGGITTSLVLWRRVWRAYTTAPATVRERLAYAVLATIGMRETLLLALPILLLVLVVGVKIGLALR